MRPPRLLLAVPAGGFCGWGSTRGGLLDPFGILGLLLAILVWFAWKPLRTGFASARGEPRYGDYPLGGSALVGGTPEQTRNPRASAG